MTRSIVARATLLLAIIVAAIALFASDPARAAGAVTIVQFSPTGTVKQVRQVTARFSDPMVPLGDPRGGPPPFNIDCSAKGAGRWLDSRNWAYDFDKDLPGGIRCAFTVHPGLKALNGQAVGGTARFAFDTGGPAIVDERPYDGDGEIDADQAFVLILDTAVKESTILAHAGFAVEGMPQRISAKFPSPTDRQVILNRFKKMIDKRPVVILESKQRFPDKANISLIWGVGIESSTGVATSQDQTLKFVTRKAFQAKFQCDRENAKAGCIPLLDMTVLFSAPIKAALAQQVAMVAPDGTRLSPEIKKDEVDVSRLTFKGPFKESSQYRIEIPPNITDDAGRTLSNASRFPMTISTDAFPPLAKFSARFGIIEAADPVLPVTVRNLEAQIATSQLDVGVTPPAAAGGLGGLLTRVEAALIRVPAPDASTILPWLRKVSDARRKQSVFGADTQGVVSYTIPKPNGPNAFEVMGIPLKRPGLYIVELKSERLGSVLLGAPQPMYVPTAALVTNLAVHFKRGAANSLVWVTELESAKPVEGAAVAIADCNGTRLWTGTTDSRGLAMVPHQDTFDNLPHCERPPSSDDDSRNYYDTEQTTAISNLDSGLLVTASSGDDFSFVHTSWQNGIEPWRFHLPMEYQPSPIAAHTVFDRTLLRAGETVHMEHFIREKTLDGFAVPAPDELPDTLSIRFLASDQHYDSDLTWTAAGTAVTNWDIPKAAKLGQYQVVMVRRKTSGPTPTPDGGYSSAPEWQSGDFQVEEFRVPLMRAAIRIPSQPLVAVTSIPVDLSAEYLSGGAAKDLPVTLRSQITKNYQPQFPDFDDFVFANGAVKEGIVQSKSWEETEETQENPGVHQRVDLTLDAAGGARAEITEIPREPIPLQVQAELEYRDPTGESQTVSNTATVFPAQRLVGIQTDGWVSSNSIRVRIAVVDDSGKPVANAPVKVALFTQKYYTYRTRLVGGFYSYQSTEDTRRAGDLCIGNTDSRGLLFCAGKAIATGQVIVQAVVTDDAGNSCSAHTEVFVPGEQREWFQASDQDRIDLIPEKPQYEPGDTARFQVRMPFAEATALVTVEREGIIGASILHLDSKDPVVVLPVRDYAPNVFVSVLAVRGRVGAVQPTAMVDLGKPAFKLGIAQIRVGWRDHRLKVTVTPEHAVYHVREKARVKVEVRTSDGKVPPDGSTFALAAVDEGLLELKPNDSWKLLDAMMGQRPYQIETSAAEMQVVGKRHYGLKAIPPGGGGGQRVTRELFNTLLLWKADVPLDANGDASVEVPLNDSLTSFKIVAIAGVGAGQFGTGSGTIRSTQDLMLFSGASPIIRIGDAFAAEFTVRNASERALDVTVTSKIDGIATTPPPQKLQLGAGEGKAIDWNVAVPMGVSELTYHVDAIAAQGAQDHLLSTQNVLPAVPVETLQSTLQQIDKPIAQPVAIPAGALKGQGGVQLNLSPSLAAGLDGVKDWMRDYPYSCLEQRVSRAVALGDPKLWAGIVADLPSYTDSDGLLKYFAIQTNGSDVLTSYVFAIAHEAGLEIPDASESKIEDALKGFIAGRITVNEAVPAPDLPLRKIAAIEALSHAGMADYAMLGSVTIEPNLWPDATVIDWWSILLRTPAIPDREPQLAAAEQIIRARLNAQGTALHLASDPRDNMWWLMVSPEQNMNRLALVVLDAKLWHDDLPRLMRGALMLQSHGSWPTTIANAWGTLAVNKFVQQFEATPVAGTTIATLATTTQHLDWSHDPKGGALSFDWPAAPADLDINHNGSGHPWAEIRARAALPLQQPFSSGYRITKTITPVEKTHTGAWKQGDLVRVHLKIEAQTDMTWVVINDPIPAGASHLGTGLARDSAIATSSENTNFDQWAWPLFVERPFDAYRAYYDYVPKGTFETEYTIRLNQVGTFGLPPTRVEALYEPEMFGESPNAAFEVAP